MARVVGDWTESPAIAKQSYRDHERRKSLFCDLRRFCAALSPAVAAGNDRTGSAKFLFDQAIDDGRL
jgi:hypothetical protein